MRLKKFLTKDFHGTGDIESPQHLTVQAAKISGRMKFNGIRRSIIGHSLHFKVNFVIEGCDVPGLKMGTSVVRIQTMSELEGVL